MRATAAEAIALRSTRGGIFFAAALKANRVAQTFPWSAYRAARTSANEQSLRLRVSLKLTVYGRLADASWGYFYSACRTVFGRSMRASQARTFKSSSSNASVYIHAYHADRETAAATSLNLSLK